MAQAKKKEETRKLREENDAEINRVFEAYEFLKTRIANLYMETLNLSRDLHDDELYQRAINLAIAKAAMKAVGLALYEAL